MTAAEMFDALPARKKLQLIRLTDIMLDLIRISAEDELMTEPEPVKKDSPQRNVRSRVRDKTMKVSETA